MDFTLARKKLAELSQEHLLKDFLSFPLLQRRQLLEQIQKLDFAVLQQQQRVLRNRGHTQPGIEPFTNFTKRGNLRLQERGCSLLAEGKAGCLLVAGGQGSRLRFDGPKGMYPISVIENKTLFRLFAEKTLAASHRAGRPLPLAVMTSEENHQTTVDYFRSQENFGLDSTQLDFFRQGTLPFLDSEGNLFFDAPAHLAEGPDGNGSSILHFVKSGIAAKWQNAGIEKVLFIMVDNPLADPFDAELIGFHAEQGNTVTVKCVARKDPEEKVGVVIKREGHVEVVEYTEISDEERHACDTRGQLKHPCANISLYCFEMAFLHKPDLVNLPLHPAFKEMKRGPDTTKISEAWKFERFIFDVLPYAEKVSALCYPREECFSPLKNAEGSDSPAAVRAFLQANDRRLLEELTGLPAPEEPFELSQAFYYPDDAFRRLWQKRKISTEGYIQ